MKPLLVILSGPSCVGKGPLLAALRRCRPDLRFASPVLFASREPRPGEADGADFHFRTATEIRHLDPGRYLAYPMRDQWRAVDLAELRDLLAKQPRVVLELHPAQVPALRARLGAETARLVAILLRPLGLEEARALARASGTQPREAVAEVMRAKQIERALRQGKLLTGAELADIETRAQAAWDEMRDDRGFDEVIVNHDAEGSDHWRYAVPIGDAGATLAAVAAVLTGEVSAAGG